MGSDMLRRAEAMGRAAGKLTASDGIPAPMPFKVGPGAPALLVQARNAWATGYLATAYPRPIHPAGQPVGLPDSAGDTAGMTAAAVTRDNRLYGDDFTALTDTPGAAATANTGVAIMAYVSAADGARLAQPGGDPADQLHVTLGYLANPAVDYTPEQRQTLQGALQTVTMPVIVDAFGVIHMNPEDDDRDPCVALAVQSQALADAHDQVTDAITQLGSDNLSTTFPIWTPHLTLGYNLDPGSVPTDLASGTVTLDRLVCAWGDDQQKIAEPNPEADDAAGENMTASTAALATNPPPAAPAASAPPAVEQPAAGGGNQAAVDLTPVGRTWSGPLAILGTPSSDNRQLKPGGGVVRPLPQPISWQEQSDEAHKGSYVVGRILTCAEREITLMTGETAMVVWGTGDYLQGWNDAVEKAQAQVDGGLGLISLDTAPSIVGFIDATTGQPVDPTWEMDPDNIIVEFEQYEIGGATIVNFPAFRDARVQNDPATEESAIEGDIMPGLPMMVPGDFAGATMDTPTVSDDGATITLTDGTTAGVGDVVGFPDQSTDGDGSQVSGVIATIDPAGMTVTVTVTPADGEDAAAPVTVPIADLVPVGADQNPADATPAPPGSMAGTDAMLTASAATQPYTAAFFKQRDLPGPTPLHIDEQTGEVFGHLATWGTCHIAHLADKGVCVTAPQGDTFERFHLTPIPTDEGMVEMGRLTVGTGHYNKQFGGYLGAIEHYDTTGSQVALVRAYEDAYGIQVTGELIHGVEPRRVDELRRSPLSGDWRGPKNHMKLCAALAVNVPGFPVINNAARLSPKIGYGPTGEQMSLVAAGVVYPDVPQEVTLPSGLKVGQDDFDSMIAAAMAAIERNNTPPKVPARHGGAEAGEMALRQARLRLALRSKR